MSWHLAFLRRPDQPPTPCPAYTGGLTVLKAARGFLVPTSLLLLPPGLNAMGLLWWLSGKEPTCQCKRCKSYTFDPWVRKIPRRRKRKPTPVFLPRKSRGQTSLAGCSPWGHKEPDMTEWLNGNNKLKCRSHLCRFRQAAFPGIPVWQRESPHLICDQGTCQFWSVPHPVAMGESPDWRLGSWAPCLPPLYNLGRRKQQGPCWIKATLCPREELHQTVKLSWYRFLYQLCQWHEAPPSASQHRAPQGCLLTRGSGHHYWTKFVQQKFSFVLDLIPKGVN